jgi:septum formation protein
MLRLILASSSPYRRELLERLKIPFEVIPPDVDETLRSGETPSTLVERLSVEKARKVADGRPGTLVIGSDQVAVYNGTIVGKPHSHDKAVEQLRSAE